MKSSLVRSQLVKHMAQASKSAFIFPGQGSQSVGMGLALRDNYRSARQAFDEADAALDCSLSRLCFEGPEDELTKTINVQPAILTTSIACLKAAQEAGAHLPTPKFLAGHSLGEYTALVAANVLSLHDAVNLVRERGRLMYEAGLRNPGAMLAILGIDSDIVEDICSQSGADISNMNCPGQIVISGTSEALAESSRLAKARSARVIPLKVSGAFHSALMEPIITEFSEVISSFGFHPPTIPIVANVTAQLLADIDSIKEELVKQLRSCIQWQKSIQYMMQNGITDFYEIGPGKILSGLIKRINPEMQTFNISGIEDIAALY